MSIERAGAISHLIPLTDDEAVTLRRVAFGQSEARALRSEDLVRLQGLRLVREGKNGLELTLSGREHYDALPRAFLADKVDRSRRR